MKITKYPSLKFISVTSCFALLIVGFSSCSKSQNTSNSYNEQNRSIASSRRQYASYAYGSYPVYKGPRVSVASYPYQDVSREEENKIARQLIKNISCDWVRYSYGNFYKTEEIPGYLVKIDGKKVLICTGVAKCEITIRSRHGLKTFEAYFEDATCASSSGNCPRASECVMNGGILDTTAIDVISDGLDDRRGRPAAEAMPAK